MSLGEAKASSLGRVRTQAQREDLNGRLMIAPTVLIVTLVAVLPFLAVVLLAFADVRLVDIPRLNLTNLNLSLENFRDAFTSSAFWGALRITVTYAALTTLGSIAVGLVVALALRRPFRGRGLIRALVLVPYVLPVVAAATIWKTMLNPQYGVINALGESVLGWDSPIAFLSTTKQEVAGIPVPVTLLAVVAFEIWKTAPLAFLFLTARLQLMPADLEEAAALDGASSFKTFRHIVFPQLRGVILLLILLRFIWSFQSFNDIFLLTGGAGGTQVMAVRVYTELITRADIGSAASYGLIMSGILAVLLLLFARLNRTERVQ